MLLTKVVDRVQQKLLRTTCNKLLKKLIMLFIFARVCYIMEVLVNRCIPGASTSFYANIVDLHHGPFKGEARDRIQCMCVLLTFQHSGFLQVVSFTNMSKSSKKPMNFKLQPVCLKSGLLQLVICRLVTTCYNNL